MSRPMPLRVRIMIAALDVLTWPLWWLLDRGNEAMTHDRRSTPDVKGNDL